MTRARATWVSLWPIALVLVIGAGIIQAQEIKPAEKVEDDWHNNYTGAPADGRAWVETPRGIGRVVRGGAWRLGSEYCRSACRTWHSPTLRFVAFGFRVVVSLPSEP